MVPTQLNQQNTVSQPQSLQSALQMDQDQHLQLQQQAAEQQQSQPQQPKRRRRTAEGTSEDATTAMPSGTRRLRRSHEACARCRSKKIKASPCDSKHPRCTACATAGTICHQEDRHRQTLTPRGHTERVEYQLAQCAALLKHHVPNFSLDNLDEYLVREGIDISTISPTPPTASFQTESSNIPKFRQDPAAAQTIVSAQQPPKGYPLYHHPPPHLMHPPYPPAIMPYGAPPGAYHPQMQLQGPPGAFNPHLLPAFQHPPPPGAPYPPPPHPVPGPPLQQQPVTQQQSASQRSVTKGQDPNGNDLSTTDSLAKNFGVHANIVSEIPPTVHDREDLAVGSNGLSSGRDRSIQETATPRDSQHWMPILIRRTSTGQAPSTLSFSRPVSSAPTVNVWLPKDRSTLQHIVDVYFQRLNIHRPVFSRKDFDKIVNDLYDGATVSYDPGYICGIYLVLALGTLSELNHRAASDDVDNKEAVQGLGLAAAKKLMPPNWPEHDEFFERALSIKPDLRVTISSLQALILLHWYLYTERQGRTLWRLVGSLVRLAIELGLHHDPRTQHNPTTQQSIFTEEEQLLRIRLWGIVLVHDRGTSILLGRPLAISPSDSNTPHPKCQRNSDGSIIDAEFSQHFELSHPVAEIQADIINSLYTPHRQDKIAIMQHATRIIKNLLEFRRQLPERYQYYFGGTEDWPLERKIQLVKGITEDEGLTLLKIGIARILLLRALFSSKELPYGQRHQALVDAIITSHNTIVVHNQLIQFPDIGFFTSPIPLHIAAMVILYGHTSRCDSLPKNTALEDIWLALDMLPRFRWRWERKDANGSHPLIAKVAERVLEVDLHTIHPEPVSNPVLLPEPMWDEDMSPTPSNMSQQTTPTLSASTAPYPAPAQSNGSTSVNTNVAYGPQPRSSTVNSTGTSNMVKGNSTPPEKSMANFPTPLFYPFYPEAPVPASNINGSSGSNSGPEYQEYLAVAATTQDGSYGNNSAHENFIDDTQHRIHHHQNMSVWPGVVSI
ncbi:hypothetical protein AMATHDRAFT_77495 [Amanita thiersii Skay4041]|uniref:Zn(2)-C6 fungal-type domain-containing protein n=1 Tax=Amanita thiersii Skay4041 TaxID=703135 RepID=A0A2A9NGB1_9AGAR|nr:hypothetical protein AMATHDRAFT_77495 [Amanita thiersii Skay4041]